MKNVTEFTEFQDIWYGNKPGYELARFEDHNLMVLLSKNPVRRGHSMIVPRQPIEHWYDLTRHQAENAMYLGQLTAKYLVAKLQPRPTRIELHAMGYRVPHTHLKIVPSYTKSDNHILFEGGDPRPNTSDYELNQAQSELQFSANLIHAANKDLTDGTTLAFDLIEQYAI